MNKKIILMLLIVSNGLSKNALASLSDVPSDYASALQAQATAFVAPITTGSWSGTVNAQNAATMASGKVIADLMPTKALGSSYMNAIGAQVNVNKALWT